MIICTYCEAIWSKTVSRKNRHHFVAVLLSRFLFIANRSFNTIDLCLVIIIAGSCCALSSYS